MKLLGNEQAICYVMADRLSFRIESEKNGPVVNQYDETDIQEAKVLTVSFNGGQTWVDTSFYQ